MCVCVYIYVYMYISIYLYLGFPTQTVKNLPAIQENWVLSLGQEEPQRREWLPSPVFLLENSVDRGVWQATVHGVAKSWTPLSD